MGGDRPGRGGGAGIAGIPRSSDSVADDHPPGVNATSGEQDDGPSTFLGALFDTVFYALLLLGSVYLVLEVLI